MVAFRARCVYPAREFPNEFRGGKAKLSATFLPVGRPDVKENRVRVNVNDFHPVRDRERAAYLRRLKRGQEVYLVVAGYYEGKPYFDILIFKGLRANAAGRAK